MTRERWLLSALASALIVGALLPGCSGGASDAASTQANVPGAAPEETKPAFGSAVESGDNELGWSQAYLDEAGEALAEADVGPAREVITTGTAYLMTPDPVGAAQRLATHIEAIGGRVENRHERGASETRPPQAYLRLRIPAREMTAIVNALSQFGKVSQVEVEHEDVTALGADLDARILALETSTGRLRDLLANANDTTDLLLVEQELTRRQADLDGLRAQRAAISDQVVMSTLEVWLNVGPEPGIAPQPVGFGGGLAAGWDALVAFGRGAAVVLGAVLPWFLLLGVLGSLGYGLLDTIRRRRRARMSGSEVRDAAVAPASH